MTKEEYIAERARISIAMNALQVQEDSLMDDYIEEHKEFNVGDCVLICCDERPHPFVEGKIIAASKTLAYIKSISEHNGVIQYKFWKSKKDHSQSVNEFHQRSYDRIELIEPSKTPQP